ncbi:hypothetical protein BDN70DRAFT_91056 [Pholiota conissans]|uniref:Uncharacterized protein n=1 Tax=Pholiota conissans TaxID=109636 RepID=A0A9P6CS55_9AGAR|nr:hypothetical protein BDN70DRAFT_91056 [Pholiota conissans]
MFCAFNSNIRSSLVQVCRRLNYAARTRSTWLAMVQRSNLRFMVNKRFELHTAQELEDLAHRKARSSAKRSSSATPIIRRNPATQFLSCTFLIPGGRWLVWLTSNRGVSYTDLESDTFEVRTLVAEHPTDDIYNGAVTLRMDMNNTTEYIAFNLLLCTVGRGDNQETSLLFPSVDNDTHHFQVFSVSLAFDDTGIVSGLRADCVSSFHECDESVDVDSISFRGNTLVYYFSGTPHCIIVDWRSANGKILNFTRRILSVPEYRSSFELLSETILILWEYRKLYIYDLPSLNLPLSTKPSIPSSLNINQASWVLPWPDPYEMIDIKSPSIPTKTSTSMLFWTSQDKVVKLTVPNSREREPPSVTMLDIESQDENAYANYTFHPENGAGAREHCITTYSYNKAEDGSIISINAFIHDVSWPQRMPREFSYESYPRVYLDDCSGRLYVLFLKDGPHHYVVDWV